MARKTYRLSRNASGTVGGLLFIGGHIITTGVIAGTLMAVGAGLILLKLRSSNHKLAQLLYRKVIQYPLWSDIVITGTAFLLAPAGITAWVAASTTGVLASCWLLAEHGGMAKELENEDTGLINGVAALDPEDPDFRRAQHVEVGLV